MILSGKFALSAALAVTTFISSIIAKNTVVPYIYKATDSTDKTDPVSVHLGDGGSVASFTLPQATKFLTAVAAPKACSGVTCEATGTSHITDGDVFQITYDTGAIVSIKATAIAATPGAFKFDVEVTAAPATYKSGSVYSVSSSDISFKTLNEISILDSKVPDGHIMKFGGLGGNHTLIENALKHEGVFSVTAPGITVSTNVKGTATPVTTLPFTGCVYVADKKRYICVAASSTGVTITVRAGISPSDMAKWLGPILLLILALLSTYGTAHIFAYVDPLGYQAGKEQSSIPSYLKSFLPDAEGATGIMSFNDGDEGASDVYVRDPSTGRIVHRKKDGKAVGGGGADGDAGEETTDAIAFCTTLGTFVAASLLLL